MLEAEGEPLNVVGSRMVVPRRTSWIPVRTPWRGCKIHQWTFSKCCGAQASDARLGWFLI